IEARAAQIEDTHARRIEVVTVSDARGDWIEPLVAAAGEAMLNAARHAGDAQVYVEVGEGPHGVRAEVFVRDRGPGFDPDTVPATRAGVRESIRGRMARAGGSSRIRSSASGTEVYLVLERPAEHMD
ncbi:MAG: ATP-binding protein, partial [Micrococcus sp.]|nr:ATP-binding protein [Micrococcus sp.]